MKHVHEDEIEVYGESLSLEFNEETGEWVEIDASQDPILAAIEKEMLRQVGCQRRSRKGGYDQ